MRARGLRVDVIEPETVDAVAAYDAVVVGGKLAAGGSSGLRRLSLFTVRGFEGDWRDWATIEQWATGIADALLESDGSSAAIEPAARTVS